MNKRERLEKTLTDLSVDRVPVSLWRPFPGDDQRAADMAHCILDFQRRYDWDFVNVYPASNYAVIDYGVQDVWEGAPDGTRRSQRFPIKRSLDWGSLRMLDPNRAELGKHFMTLKMVEEGLRGGGGGTDGTETPLIMTIYSPLAQASRLADEGLFIRNIRKHPERVSSGLNVITDSTLLFLESLKKLNISGIYYIIEHADYDVLAKEEYIKFGLEYDKKILESLPPEWWLNIVYLRGTSPMFDVVAQLPPYVINWHDHIAPPSLAESRVLLKSAACGGLDAESHLRAATPAIIRDTARRALLDMHERRLILSAGGPILSTTPLSNIRALRDVVEKVQI